MDNQTLHFNQTLHLAKRHRDYWIGRAQELQSRLPQLADEILEFTEMEVKNYSIPAVSNRRELLIAFVKYSDKMMVENDTRTADLYIDTFLKSNL